MKEDSANGIDFPAFHPSIVESDEDGEAKNRLRLKSAQVHTFMRISEKLITPLLGEYVDDIGWQAWLAHVEYFKSMTASSFTLASIKELDKQIQEHQKLYAQVCMRTAAICRHIGRMHRHQPPSTIRGLCVCCPADPLRFYAPCHYLYAGARRALFAEAPFCAPCALRHRVRWPAALLLVLPL